MVVCRISLSSVCLVVRTFLGSGSFSSPVIYLVDCSLLSWEDPTSGSFWPSYCVPLVFSWVFFWKFWILGGKIAIVRIIYHGVFLFLLFPETLNFVNRQHRFRCGFDLHVWKLSARSKILVTGVCDKNKMLNGERAFILNR